MSVPRRPGAEVDPRLLAHRPSVLLFAALGLIALLTFRDYGVRIDEPAWREYGDRLLRFYLTAGADRRALHSWNWQLYGGAFDLADAVWRRLVPLPPHEARHLLCAAAGLAGLAACWKSAAFLAGPPAGFWAVLLLAATPLYWGNAFMNGRDLPFAAAYAGASYALLRWIPRLPRVPPRLVLAFGGAAGVAMGIRVGGVVLFAYAATLGAAWLLVAAPKAPWRDAGRILAAVGGAAAAAYLVMLAFWPYALVSPLTGPWHALVYFARFDYDFPLRFAGRTVLSTDLPRAYVPVHLLRALPEIFPALLAAAAVKLARSRPLRLGPSLAAGLLALAAAFPALYAVAARVPLYNGLRHLLFIVPPAAALAGVMMAGVWEGLAARPLRVRLAGRAVLLAWALWHVSLLVRLHPYPHLYASAFGGGAGSSADRYEGDYYTAAISGVARRLEAHEAARVYVCPSPQCAADFLPHRMRIVDAPRDADLLIVAEHPQCAGLERGRTLFTVERMGRRLAGAYGPRRDGAPPAAGTPVRGY